MGSRAACGGPDVACMRCARLPAGPAPLAARGLTAVLARAGPAGGGGHCAYSNDHVAA